MVDQPKEELREDRLKLKLLLAQLPLEANEVAMIEKLVDMSENAILQEVIDQAELFPERGIGSIEPVRAVRVEILTNKMKGN